MSRRIGSQAGRLRTRFEPIQDQPAQTPPGAGAVGGPDGEERSPKGRTKCLIVTEGRSRLLLEKALPDLTITHLGWPCGWPIVGS